MTLAKSYEPAEFEQKLYQFWEKSGFFKLGCGATDNAPSYSILLPPPNVTGTLHMGHAFQHTLMDALIRYHRMRGFNVLWQAGTDHAGIATQLVVERQLEQQGTNKNKLGREEFLKRVWAWKEESGSTITKQMRRIGSSCDWEREKFTMDAELSQTVTEIFVRLYNEGLIYRGKRLVNWDPKIKTAVSDLEVEMQEQDGFMWHICYPFSDGPQKDHLGNNIRGMVIATTRPETMMADGALAVHPEDERYQHLVGKYVDLPLCSRKIPIIADDFVERDFGSGCVKITGAHDFNDYQCSLRHNIKLIIIMDEKAEMNENVPAVYIGLNRYKAREAVVADLIKHDFLVKKERHQNKVPICTRTGEVVEPMLTDQWFVKMDGLAKVGLETAQNGEVAFVPPNWINTYRSWLDNIQDWCISRQLWWGHRIPAWFDDEGKCYVARNLGEAQKISGKVHLRQDEDVLDTWFSSALWPFSTLGWQPGEKVSDNQLLKTYLPTSVLITGFDIIFFWVARMVMLTKHILGVAPFKDVHITGLVRDAEGHKMSKSVGNVIDPLDLMDGISLEALLAKRVQGLMQPHLRDKIEKDTRKHFSEGIAPVGADALRFTFAALASHGRDIKFDHHRCQGYRNFCTKLWNATRFVLMQFEKHFPENKIDVNVNDLPAPNWAEQWIINRLQYAEKECAEHFANYRFDLLAKIIFETIWNDFCDWFVEMEKVHLQDVNPQKAKTSTIRSARILEALLRLAHPLIPFITEELWLNLAPLIGKNAPTIMLEKYPEYEEQKVVTIVDSEFEILKLLVEETRRLRSEMNIPPNQKIQLIISGENPESFENITLNKILDYLKSLAKVSEVEILTKLPNLPAPTAVVMGLQLMLKVEIDVQAEIVRLGKETEKLSQENARINAQLLNSGFTAKAPSEVVAKLQQRLDETQQKINSNNNILAKLQSANN